MPVMDSPVEENRQNTHFAPGGWSAYCAWARMQAEAPQSLEPCDRDTQEPDRK